MGLLDKIKNLFLEDEEESEEVVLEEENKNVYEEPKDVLPKVMRDTILEESKKQEEKVEKKFNFPVDVSLNDTPSRVSNNINKNVNSNVTINNNNSKPITSRVNNNINNGLNVNREVSKKTVELYPKKEEPKFKQKFKPTPVISPVYGVLDKNYKKDEVREKPEDKFEMRRPSKKVDFETVRKKAFGNLSDDIRDNLMCENCELYKEAKRISEIGRDDLLYDMLVDDSKDEELTIEKAYDNYEDYGVAYEPDRNISLTTVEDEILEDIKMVDKIEDAMELNEEESSDVLEENIDKVLDEIPTRSDKKKDNKVDDDFFQLIDSMYKERVDD